MTLSPRATLHSSDSNEWYTPARILEAARAVLGGIDLDPASSAAANQTVQAARYYTKDTDGLTRPWRGRVWLNPPYGKTATGSSNQGRWSKRLIDAYTAGDVAAAVLLVNACTGDGWFAPLWAYPLCFVRGRIHFIPADGQKNSPTHSSVLAYFGPDAARFRAVFGALGHVVVPS